MLFKKEVKIHEKIFPLATPEDQLMHLCEELKEMDEAEEEEFFKEWADALFVAISLQRFKHTKHLAEIMLDVLYFNYPAEIQLVLDEHLAQAIKKVKSRKYYFINNHYEREKNV